MDGVVTSSSQVQHTYYGQPVIKAPHWRWLVIFYFFFGGLAGACATIATIAEYFSADRSVARAARYLSFLALLPCPPLLVLDLGRPERFLHMLRIVKLKSPMSLGSWALTFASGFITVGALCQVVADLGGDHLLRKARRAAAIGGLPFTIFLSGYTGILLAATNVPLWWRASPFLSPTFISSAYSTSLAAISLFLNLAGGVDDENTPRRLARAEVLCMSAELSFLGAVLLRLGRIGKPLTTGRLGLIFWPITVADGIVVPLATLITGPARGRLRSRSWRINTSVHVLIGGLTLRALMVFAGRKSANIPEDYFALTAKREE